MKRILRTIAVLGTAGFACSALPAWSQAAGGSSPGAATEQWTFNNVTFSSGGSLTGYFTVNAVTHSLITWNITSSAGTATYYNGATFATMSVPGFTYEPSTSWSGTSNVILTDPIGQPLWFIAGMAGNTSGSPQLGVTLTATNDPNIVSVSTNSGENWANSASASHLASRGFATGYIQRSLVSPVPEPSTLLLTLAGLAVVGGMLRQKRAVQAPASPGLQPA